MISDLLPCLFCIEAAAERVLVTLLKVKRQLLHDFSLLCVGDPQRRKILTHVCSEVRHFRDLPPACSAIRKALQDTARPSGTRPRLQTAAQCLRRSHSRDVVCFRAARVSAARRFPFFGHSHPSLRLPYSALLTARRLIQLLAVLFIAPAAGQQPQRDLPIDEVIRTSVIGRLLSRVEAGYVIPEAAQIAIRNLRTAQVSGEYQGVGTARRFAARLTSDLRSATHDKHIAVFFDPEPATPAKSSTPPAKARERFNFGFYKIERLWGNVGYLELRSFANLDEGRETASAYLDAVANFDAIIIDLRQNGGGNTPMAAYIASYFFGPKPVHFTDMYWRDQNKTVEVWTSENVPGVDQ